MFGRVGATFGPRASLGWQRRWCAQNSGGAVPSAVRGAGRRFWEWTTRERPSWRESKVEAAVLFCVFGVTGSSSVALVRPALKSTLGLEGTLKDGPWSYRVASVLLVSPIYACVLISVGTLAGRHRYFATMGRKILGRFVPPALRPKIVCAQARERVLHDAQRVPAKARNE